MMCLLYPSLGTLVQYLISDHHTTSMLCTSEEESGLSNGNYPPEAALQPATKVSEIFYQLVHHISTLIL